MHLWLILHLLRLLLLLHDLLAGHVDVARVLDVIDQHVELGLTDTFLVQEVLNCEEIEAHLGGLLHELLLLVKEVLWDLARLRCVGAH